MQIRLRAGAALARGAFDDNRTHRHHAAQVFLPAEGPLELVPPGVEHRVEGVGTVLLVEPVSAAGRRLLDAPPQGDLGRALADPDPDAALAEALATLGAGPALDPALDPRVARVLTWLDEALAAEARPRLADAARLAGLSESRFRRVLAARVGLPWSRLIPWRRIQVATASALAGRDLTTAAHAAGFADAAHLSRTFRQMFGFTPSEVLRR